MPIIDRIRNILLTPKTEWVQINNETATPFGLLTGYVMPLALAAAAAAFIGMGFFGSSFMGIRQGGTISYGIYAGLSVLVSYAAGFYISTYVVDLLAPSFKSEKDLGKSAQLVAYSYTPGLVGALLAAIPAISFIGSLFGLYGLYLIYTGLPVLKKTPEEQRIPYIVVTILVLIAVYIVLGMLLAAILLPIMGISALTGLR
jgi:hypothetical protein